MRLPGRMLLFLARMDEPLMSHQQVAARKVLVADLAYKRLLLSMGAYMPLEVFLYHAYACQSPSAIELEVDDGRRAYQARKEALAVRARQRLGLVA